MAETARLLHEQLMLQVADPDPDGFFSCHVSTPAIIIVATIDHDRKIFKAMTITYHTELDQGSDEWIAARCGVLTASEMKHVLTPTLKLANNDKTRQHVYEMAAQRLTGYVEPHYIGDEMLRGWQDEIRARQLYSELYHEVAEVGFVTRDDSGFTLGYSPDGLVGDDGMIEIKSRRQKYQVQTISESTVPDEFMLQLQTGLLVTDRQWIDFISYCGGLPMFVCRVLPDENIQAAILEAATAFEIRVQQVMQSFTDNVAAHGYAKTEREVEQEMIF